MTFEPSRYELGAVQKTRVVGDVPTDDGELVSPQARNEICRSRHIFKNAASLSRIRAASVRPFCKRASIVPACRSMAAATLCSFEVMVDNGTGARPDAPPGTVHTPVTRRFDAAFSGE